MNRMIRPAALPYLAAVTAVIVWGFSFIWTNTLLLRGIPVFTFIFVRMLLAAIILAAFSKGIGKLSKIEKGDRGWLILMAFFEPFIYFIGESFGIKATGSPTLGAVIVATIPLFCLFAERLFFSVKLTFYKVAGISLTIPGILLVVFRKDTFSAEHISGILLLFLAVAGSTGYTAIARRLSGKYNSYTLAAYQFIFGALFFLPFFILFGTDGIDAGFFSPEILLPLTGLAVLCSCLAFWCYITAIRELGMTRANIFTALIPAVSAFGATLLGQESLRPVQIAGIAIVIAGVILAQWKSAGTT